MKLLLLIIYSHNKYYDKMLEYQRLYVNKHINVDAYFIQSNYEHNEPVYIDGDMIHVRGKENHNTILYKTLYSMETLKNLYKKEYDFTIRTNISTIFNIPKLINLLNEFKHIEYLYGGDICTIFKCNKNISFAVGTCIIFSKKVYDIMIEKIHLFNHNIEDDVAFGLFIQEHLPCAFNHNLKMNKYVLYNNRLPNGYNTNLNDFIDYIKNDKSNYIYYRNSTNNRFEDANIIHYICNNLIN